MQKTRVRLLVSLALAILAGVGDVSAGVTLTPLELVGSTPRGELKNPYSAAAAAAMAGVAVGEWRRHSPGPPTTTPSGGIVTNRKLRDIVKDQKLLVLAESATVREACRFMWERRRHSVSSSLP